MSVPLIQTIFPLKPHRNKRISPEQRDASKSAACFLSQGAKRFFPKIHGPKCMSFTQFLQKISMPIRLLNKTRCTSETKTLTHNLECCAIKSVQISYLRCENTTKLMIRGAGDFDSLSFQHPNNTGTRQYSPKALPTFKLFNNRIGMNSS